MFSSSSNIIKFIEKILWHLTESVNSVMRWDINMKKCRKEYMSGTPRVKKQKQTAKMWGEAEKNNQTHAESIS